LDQLLDIIGYFTIFIVIIIIGYFYVLLLIIIDIFNCQWFSLDDFNYCNCNDHHFWMSIVMFILMIITTVVIIMFIVYSDLFFNHEHGWHGYGKHWKTMENPWFQTNMIYTKLMIYLSISSNM
jgi:H+/Cl- antiporter ClcA